MNAPVFDEIENSNNTGKIIPIYPLTFSLTQNTLRKIIENGLQKVQEQGGLPETLPDYILKEYKLENENIYLCTMPQIYPEDRGMNYAIRAGNKITKEILENDKNKMGK